ncbi:hypothetical protein WCLP8_970005 [uncultured Gammaproteobacteria bacterium]
MLFRFLVVRQRSGRFLASATLPRHWFNSRAGIFPAQSLTCVLSPVFPAAVLGKLPRITTISLSSVITTFVPEMEDNGKRNNPAMCEFALATHDHPWTHTAVVVDR